MLISSYFWLFHTICYIFTVYGRSLLTLFRWYEDLQCQDVDDVIDERLAAGEELKLPYGKLMERLLTFKMIRENIPARARYGFKRVEEKKKEEQTKAKFISRLIPLAERRLQEIRCSPLSTFSSLTRVMLLITELYSICV